MDKIKSDLQKAKTLIDNKKYEEAYVLLMTIEHPIADKWIQRLEKLMPTKTEIITTRSPIWLRYSSLLIGISLSSVVVLLMVSVLGPTLSNIPQTAWIFVIIGAWIVGTVIFTTLAKSIIRSLVKST